MIIFNKKEEDGVWLICGDYHRLTKLKTICLSRCLFDWRWIISQGEIKHKTYSTQGSLKQKEDMSILEFRDNDKVNEIFNAMHLVLTASIANCLVSGILIDDESYCDVMYVNTFTKLGLRDLDLVP